MGFINFFSTNFLSNNFSIFSMLNTAKSLFLNPYNFTFFEISSPFAIDNEILILEKLPGPWLLMTVKFLLSFAL